MKSRILSGTIVSLLLVGMLTLAFNIQPAKASGTLYIGSDYTFTSDIFEPIVVTADNIVIDGNGFTLQGSGSGSGFNLTNISNVTIQNTNIKNFLYGVNLNSSSGNTVAGNDITDNTYGVFLYPYCYNNTVSGNTIANNTAFGVYLYYSSNNTIHGNTITDNSRGVYLWYSSCNNTVFGNTITDNEHDGVSIYHFSNNNTISGNTIANNHDNGVRLDLSSNNTVSGNTVTNNNDGVTLVFWSYNNTVSGNNLTNNTDYGVWFYLSSNNTLRDNNMANGMRNFGVGGDSLQDFVNDVDTSNTVDGKPIYYWINRRDVAVPLDAGYVALVDCTNITVQNLSFANIRGVLLAYTTNSTITTNNITDTLYGVLLHGSSNNTLTGNNITNTGFGIVIFLDSSNNTIHGNNITNNLNGILLRDSSNNTISGNTVTNNTLGVELQWSSNNKIYHNNFIDNTQQVYDPSWDYPETYPPSINAWDDGYPSGGNYWSDYDGTDADGDGIGDTPYVIDENNQDNYPLMEPWSPVEVPPVEETEAYIEYVNETMQDLPDDIFSGPEEDVPDVKNDFSDLFNDTLENIDEENYEEAIEKLNRIKEKIYEEMAESAERQELISMIDELIAYLETLL